jgi:hypothetical protein
MLVFQSFAFGIMVEDAVQAIWRRLTGEKFQFQESVPVWKKTIGFV